jgi:murein DD-endopeptidase MepM/ murein hydrolase activator NlpD
LGRLFTVILLSVFAREAWAISVSQSRLASSVDEHYCKVPMEVSVVQPTQRQVFLWFIARGVKAGDALQVEWLDPSGAVSTTARYDDLPAASELCITTQLPVAGFAAASQPGEWAARVTTSGRQLASKRFQMAAYSYDRGPRVTSVAWSRSGAAESDFTVRGDGFQPGTLVHIAEYTRSGGWRYLASLQPRSLSPNELTAHYSGLPAAEYLAIVETPDLRMSRPVPFLISTIGYKLPFASREPWVLTQGPYGTFSHWGNSLHAFDIAPMTGRCVVAMRGGIAYTHDNHAHQDHAHRSFGNYITIDHGDGEFSHYAHLATGTFVVASGQRVEQGQALATAGNSGYTLGEGGGYHVHVHVTRALPIAAQSIPFQFEDLPGGARAGLPRTIVSTNDSAFCDCRSAQPGAPSGNPQVAATAAPRSAPPQFAGSLSVEQWWSEVVTVAKRSKTFDVTLEWKPAEADLDLHVVSPSGTHYSWYGNTTGYSGTKANPQQFRLPRPEPGFWRVSVQAVKGGTAPIEFGLSTSGQKARAGTPAVGGSR